MESWFQLSCPLPGYSLVVFAFSFLLLIPIIPLIQFPCFAEWAACLIVNVSFFCGNVGVGGSKIFALWLMLILLWLNAEVSFLLQPQYIWLISHWYQKRVKLENWNRDCIYFHLILLQCLVVSQGITGALFVSDNDPVLIPKPYMNPGNMRWELFWMYQCCCCSSQCMNSYNSYIFQILQLK